MNRNRILATAILLCVSFVPERARSKTSAPSDTSWLVFLPGSECEHYDSDDSRWVDEIIKLRPFKLLVIEKVGVRADGSCDIDKFREHSIRGRRIADIKAAMAREIPHDAEILLVGESEGGYIAPDIAVADLRVKRLIELSAGTRSWIDEEISFVALSEQPALRKFFDDFVVGNPDPKKFYHEWSYAELNSFDTHQTYESLFHLDIPVLMFNGDRDRLTWVAGTIADVKDLMSRGKSNIELYLFEGANHGLEREKGDSLCEAGALRSSQNRLIRNFVNLF